MKLNWNFLGGGGGGAKQTNKKWLPWGEYGYFLEVHNLQLYINIHGKTTMKMIVMTATA